MVFSSSVYFEAFSLWVMGHAALKGNLLPLCSLLCSFIFSMYNVLSDPMVTWHQSFNTMQRNSFLEQIFCAKLSDFYQLVLCLSQICINHTSDLPSTPHFTAIIKWYFRNNSHSDLRFTKKKNLNTIISVTLLRVNSCLCTLSQWVMPLID